MEKWQDRLWTLLKEHEGNEFVTAKGLAYSYVIKGGEMFVSRRTKSITAATIFMAYKRAEELEWIVTGPKKLGTFGASYIYPVFKKLGIIKKEPDKVHGDICNG